MKLLEKEHTQSPSGSHGSYIQLTAKKGIKIFNKEHYNTKEEAKAGFTYDEAMAEKAFYEYLHAKGCDFIPRCYNVAFIKIGEFWRVGLILQHLGTVRLKDKVTNYDERSKIEDEFRNRLLNEFQLQHRDLHYENLMFFEGKYWAIDFGARYVDIIKP